MTLTLNGAITRVRRYLDDVNNGSDARWSDAEILDAIHISLDSMLHEIVLNGVHQPIRQSTTSSIDGGIVTLVPNVLKVISLFIVSGNARLPVFAGGARNRGVLGSGFGTSVEYDYILKNNVNFATSTPAVEKITYGTVDIDNAAWDSYLCSLAALECGVKEAEANQALENQMARHRAAVMTTPVTGSISVFPQNSNVLSQLAGYRLSYYMKSPTTLEVYL